MFNNFPLPHGTDDEDKNPGNADNPPTRYEFEERFSDDDDGHKEAFDRTFPGPKKKKSPRRPDDTGSEHAPSPKKKKFVSLFGGPTEHSDDEKDTRIECKTAGPSIGTRLSSLTLDQQNSVDNDEGTSASGVTPGSPLGHSDKEASARASTAPSECSSRCNFPLREDPVASYGLRKNIDRQVVSSTWIDIDQSGDFDPEEESRQQKKAKKRKAKQKAPAKPKDGKPKFIVKLRFSNIGTVLNLVDGEENWPDGWSVVDTDVERESQDTRSLYHRNTPRAKYQEPIPDPNGEYHDLTGHPIARGCKECRKDEQPCSMIMDGAFPCAECNADGINCEPIMDSHVQGGPCKRCSETDNDRPCSFTRPGSALAPEDVCDQCYAAGLMTCTAGPKEYKSHRIDLDQILYGPDRKWVNCTYCRTHGKRCSIKKRTDKPPCKFCRRKGIGCTFYEAPEPGSSKKARKKKASEKAHRGSLLSRIAPEVSIPGADMFNDDDMADLFADARGEDGALAREESPEIVMEDTAGRRGVLTDIRTCFSHPIQFKTMDPGNSICSFCDMPIFGFVGHWENTVHVIKWFNGLGYTEFAAGYSEAHGPTIMCQECVMARVQIIYCDAHDIQPVTNHVSHEEAVDNLLEARAGSLAVRAELQHWCSLCFTLASFRCCAVQPSLMYHGDGEQELIEGCGLRLCDTCHRRLCEEFDGDLDAMTTVLDDEPKARAEAETEVNVARADVGFLRRNGLLMANVDHDSGNAEAGMELEN